jgi:Tol biopolymer transport system component
MKSSLCKFAILVLVLFALRLDAAAKHPINGKIAFHSIRDGNNEIYVMNQDGSGQTRLTVDPVPDVQPAWSPDGAKIAFVHNLDIAVINADGTGLIVLTQGGSINGAPEWSPDGKRIAFHSNRTGNFEIFVMNADGSNVVQLTNNAAGDFQPTWSPDGAKIAFRSLRDGDNDIFIMSSVNGTGLTNLTHNTADDQDPAFSPDGTRIAFTQANPSRQVFVMNADGTNPVQLTTTGDNFSPGFSPDGNKITFTSTRDGNPEIYSMNADGTSQTRLTSVAATDDSPAWQPAFRRSTIGLYRPSTGQWFLRNSNTAGPADIVLTFGGEPGDLPVVGDWNGDGATDIGIFRNGTFLLGVVKPAIRCFPCALVATVDPQPQFSFGQAGDKPIAGDWDGDGLDEVGVFRDGTADNPSTFLLRQRKIVHGFTTFITVSHPFGDPGDLPMAGDWNGDGKDTVGTFHLGVFIATEDFFEASASSVFGVDGDLPVAGDWLGVRADRFGLFHPPTATVSLETQIQLGPDVNFTFGAAGDLPVSGHWLILP